MTDRRYARYHADPAAIAMMKRDGIGWGHDLKGGCLMALQPTRPKHALKLLIKTLKG